MLDEVKQAIPALQDRRGYSHEEATQAAERVSALLERYTDYGRKYAEVGFPPPDSDFFKRFCLHFYQEDAESFVSLFQDYFFKGYNAHMNQQEETPHE